MIVCRDLEDLARKASVEFVRLVNQSVAKEGRFVAVLSGGSTPKGLYSLLATPEFREQVPWPQVHLFWGDERCVPPDYPESNHRMIHEALLSKVPIPKENIYRMHGERSPEEAASEYEQTLQRFFQLSESDLPCFDLILLGLGEDGHTASLFPGGYAMHETKRLVAAPYVERLRSHRLTLTLPVLNQGADIFFLVAGRNKAGVLRDVLQGGDGSESLPARLIQPRRGRLVWFVDDAASLLLGPQYISEAVVHKL